MEMILGVNNFNWWLKVSFLADITGTLNDVQMGLQEEFKMITETAGFHSKGSC
jgi:hypothetical protein